MHINVTLPSPQRGWAPSPEPFSYVKFLKEAKGTLRPKPFFAMSGRRRRRHDGSYEHLLERMVYQAPKSLLITLYVLLSMFSPSLGISQAAVSAPSPCALGYVRHWPEDVPIQRVTMPRPVAKTEASVQLEWLGHSSFLMTSPAGLRMLIDPSALYPPSPTPDVVTVSNLHGTHNAVERIPGTPRVLWGLLPDARWNPIVLTIRDVSLFNVPSFASRSQLEESPVQNSIFVFHTGNLCIVHLGNLRHPLTVKQLQRLGTPDVVMIPVDGQWTMSYPDVLRVITQLQPRLVIPMHIDFALHADVFVQYTAGRYPIRRISGRTLALRRSDLPAATEIAVFGEREHSEPR